MHYPACPNCGVAGPNLNCNLHPMPKFGNMTNPCKEIPQPIIDEEKRWLFAETGRLFFENKRLLEENQSLKEMLSKLQKDGIIDQLGRKLPLPGHHEDCEYGQNGWSMCYCEEIDKIKQAEDGWKVCMQDSYGNRQYECLKCHYVTKWVKDHSELATAKEHACPSPIDRAFDDLMDDDEGPKKCLHGNLECKRCNPTRAIKTPEGKPLDDAKSFKDLVDEGQELRKKFDKDTAGMRGAPNCPKCGDTGLISYGPGTRGMKRCDCRTQRLVEEDEFTRVMNETYEHLPPRPRDPRQDLKPGDHVRFEIEGIIKERQSAGIFQDEDGNDFEPIQYAIKDSINGKTYYVGYHQVTKKLGREE